MAEEPWCPVRTSDVAVTEQKQSDCPRGPPAKRRRYAHTSDSALEPTHTTTTYGDSAACRDYWPEDITDTIAYALSPQKPKRSRPHAAGYHCTTCDTVWKTESDYKKDQSRHELPHRCPFDGCSRRAKGFSTVNDLNRHLKAVHHIRFAGTRDWKCFVSGCSRTDRTWPRLDNFRQHIIRMHKGYNVDEVVHWSEQWYEAIISTQHGVAASDQSQSLRVADSTAQKAESSRTHNSKRPMQSYRNERSSARKSQKDDRPHTATDCGDQSKHDAPEAIEAHNVHDLEAVSSGWLSPVASIATLSPSLASCSLLNVAPADHVVGQGHATVDTPLVQCQQQVPSILVSPPSRVSTPRRSHEEVYSRPKRVDSATLRLQRILAGYHSAAIDSVGQPDDAVYRAGDRAVGLVNRSDSDSSAFTATRSTKHTQVGGPPSKNRFGSARGGDRGRDNDAGDCVHSASEDRQVENQPEAFYACPLHKFDAMVYAACQSYRAKTVDAICLHVLTYHVDRGHVDRATSTRLTNRGKIYRRGPFQQWYELYQELFGAQTQSFQLTLPGPFWAPCISSTNLDDLVRATVELSGVGMRTLGLNEDPDTGGDSLISFHRRLELIRQLTSQGEELELEQVRRRWRVVYEHSLTRLATYSGFDPCILHDFSESHTSQGTTQHRVPLHKGPLGTTAHAVSSPESLSLHDFYEQSVEVDLPSPPVALPISAFGVTPAEKAWSRHSTPNDSGFEGNRCRWLPEQDDPALCRLCSKTRDLHDM